MEVSKLTQNREESKRRGQFASSQSTAEVPYVPSLFKYIHTYIHTYVHIHTNTHTHTHTTWTCLNNCTHHFQCELEM